jgi:hypothetical protein
LTTDECEYVCGVSGYNTSEILNFTTSNKECYSSDEGLAGTTQCSGVPYRDDYLQPDTNGIHTKRHTVLFNLYAFDGLNSITLIIPSLTLINCEFTPFLDED